MPVSVKRSPFVAPTTEPVPMVKLRKPWLYLLEALAPPPAYDALMYKVDWPVITRAWLGVLAGYTAISGTVTRALNGIREGNNKSGPPHLGILGLGYVEEIVLDIDGVSEINYRITTAGIAVYRDHIARYGPLDRKPKDKEGCINTRYRKDKS